MRVCDTKTGEIVELTFFPDSLIAYIRRGPSFETLYSASITIPETDIDDKELIEVKGVRIVDAANHIQQRFSFAVVK